MTMASAGLTCSEVERDELDLKYLRGELSPEQAEAFEAHYFACDRCWELVHAGAEIRAARPARGRRRVLPWPLLAAAVLVGAVGIGLWRSQRPNPPADSERAGSPGALLLGVSGDATTLTASWSPLAGAAGYRVRLFAPDGAVLSERETTDTSVSLSRGSLPSSGPFFWQVQALDRLGGELARSALTDALPQPRAPAP
jgi:anti-sigma factor RsiW